MEQIIKHQSLVEIEKSLVQNDKTKIKFKLSVETPDRGNDIVRVNGINLQNYLKNPIVLFNHDHSIPPIGVGEEIYVEGDTLYGSINFHEDTELSQSLAKLARKGILKAVSIGFIPIKVKEIPISEQDSRAYPYTTSYRVFEESELLEFSLVAVPANQHALVVNAFNIDEIETFIDTKAIEKGEIELIGEPIMEEKEVEVVEQPIEKAGRVLNKKNLEGIRKAIELLSEVLSSTEALDEDKTEQEDEIKDFTVEDSEIILEKILKNRK